MRQKRELGRIAAISAICKDCGKSFAMDRKEIRWYSVMGFQLPKRCLECRKKKGA